MQYVGQFKDFVDWQYEHDVMQAIVDRNKIAIDWVENGDKAHLKASSTDGVRYEGNITYPAIRDQRMQVTLTKYEALDGSLMLIGSWQQDGTGTEAVCIIQLKQG